MPRGPAGPGCGALHSGSHRWCVVFGVCLSSAVCLWSCHVSVFFGLVCIRAVRRAGLGGFCWGVLHSGTDVPGALAFLLLWHCSDVRLFASFLTHRLCHFQSWLVASLACVVGAPSLSFLWSLYFCCVASVASPVAPGSWPGTSWPGQSSGHLWGRCRAGNWLSLLVWHGVCSLPVVCMWLFGCGVRAFVGCLGMCLLAPGAVAFVCLLAVA